MYPPWVLVRGKLDRATYWRRYRHQPHRLPPKVLAELQALRDGYDAPLVLLCHCDLKKPGGRCHRTMLAEWIGQKLGLEVPELG